MTDTAAPHKGGLRERIERGETSLRRACGRGEDLSGLVLVSGDLSGADLAGARLDAALLAGTRLVEADLRGASLKAAALVGADLRGADLRDADLAGADLTRADLRDARLAGVDLRGARVDHASIAWDAAALCGVRLDRAQIALLLTAVADSDGPADLVDAARELAARASTQEPGAGLST